MSSKYRNYNYNMPGNIQVRFKTDHENGFSVYIEVIDKAADKTISSYGRRFDNEISVGVYESFVKNFMSSPAYREQFRRDGERWLGVLDLDVEQSDVGDIKIDRRCLKAIHSINRRPTKVLKRHNYANLKTYGRDGFSALKPEELNELVSPEDRAKIGEQLLSAGRENVLKAMRWVARGLLVHHAIRKVKIDIEITGKTLKKIRRAKRKGW